MGAYSKRKVRLKLLLLSVTLFSTGIYGTATASDPLFCAVGWDGGFTHIDPKVGEIPPFRNDLPLKLNSLATAPDGTVYAGAGDGEIYTIDPWTGDVEHILSLGFWFDIRAIAISATGKFYISDGGIDLYNIDITDGSYDLLGRLQGGFAQGLAFSPGGLLYAVNPTGDKLSIIDLDTLQVTPIDEPL